MKKKDDRSSLVGESGKNCRARVLGEETRLGETRVRENLLGLESFINYYTIIKYQKKYDRASCFTVKDAEKYLHNQSHTQKFPTCSMNKFLRKMMKMKRCL